MKNEINFTKIVADVKAELIQHISTGRHSYGTWKVKSSYTLTKIDEDGDRTRETFNHYFTTHIEDLVQPAEDIEEYNKRDARLAEMLIEETKERIALEITEFYGYEWGGQEWVAISNEL